MILIGILIKAEVCWHVDERNAKIIGFISSLNFTMQNYFNAKFKVFYGTQITSLTLSTSTCLQ